MKYSEPSRPQPPPTTGGKEIYALVMADVLSRAIAGREKYGTFLQAHNGRSALVDLYQELLDACMYIRQLLEEEKFNE